MREMSLLFSPVGLPHGSKPGRAPCVVGTSAPTASVFGALCLPWPQSRGEGAAGQGCHQFDDAIALEAAEEKGQANFCQLRSSKTLGVSPWLSSEENK